MKYEERVEMEQKVYEKMVLEYPPGQEGLVMNIITEMTNKDLLVSASLYLN